MGEERSTVRARVSGRVQGVSFRAWTQIEAERRGLDGWVRNEKDGSVSALLSGPPAAVREMVERLRAGPRAAAVADVEATEAATEPDWVGVRILA